MPPVKGAELPLPSGLGGSVLGTFEVVVLRLGLRHRVLAPRADERPEDQQDDGDEQAQHEEQAHETSDRGGRQPGHEAPEQHDDDDGDEEADDEAGVLLEERADLAGALGLLLGLLDRLLLRLVRGLVLLGVLVGHLVGLLLVGLGIRGVGIGLLGLVLLHGLLAGLLGLVLAGLLLHVRAGRDVGTDLDLGEPSVDLVGALLELGHEGQQGSLLVAPLAALVEERLALLEFRVDHRLESAESGLHDGVERVERVSRRSGGALCHGLIPFRIWCRDGSHAPRSG